MEHFTQKIGPIGQTIDEFKFGAEIIFRTKRCPLTWRSILIGIVLTIALYK